MLYIFERKDIGSSFRRCFFIIDRDYDPGIEYSALPLLNEDKERLSMTYGHSFENYFLDRKNLKRLFINYSLSEEALNEYIEHLKLFSEKACKYFAALATVTHFYGKSGKKYKTRYRVETIFNNDVLINEGIDEERYRTEYQSMMDYIQQDKKHMEHYKKIKKMIMEAPELYIRGHNCYYHLEQYLASIHRVYLPADYRRIVKLFDIRFDGYDL